LKRIALDTNIVIDFFKNKNETIDLLREYDVHYLPITVCGELLFGAINSERKQQNLKRTKQFFKTCKILNNTMEVANTYAEIRFDLRKKGKPIPENDIWIAASCLVNNLPLFTKDAHFSYIDKLKVV